MDLIERQAAIDAVRAMQTYKLHEGDDMLLIDKAEAQTELMMLPSAQPEQRWIPFVKRPLTEEEAKMYPDWCYILENPLPEDGQEILVSRGNMVWIDEFYNDGECGLDGGDDVEDDMAWMPLPEPYKAERRTDE